MVIVQKEVLKAVNGENYLKLNGFLIHSKYNPSIEAKKFAEKHYKPEYIHIIFGAGLGYYIKELAKIFKYNETLLVIDPLLEKGKKLEGAQIIDFSYKEDEIFKQLFSKIKITDNVNLITTPNYDRVFEEEYGLFLKVLKKKLIMDRVSINTYRNFQDAWLQNYIKNLKNTIMDKSISVLKNKLNYPVVIASGGPSLNKHLDFLQKNREKFLLIASGSTINSLLKANIEPDFVVSIDGSEENWGHFEHLEIGNAKLIYSLTNHYKIRDVFNKDGYYFLNTSNINLLPHISKITGKEIIPIRGGGSVANFALSVALLITKSPIALIGQDLSYTGNKTHADNNKYLKELSEDAINNKSVFLMEDCYGNDVYTDYPFLMMKEAFEMIMLNSGRDNVFNCTEGGLKINGIPNMRFQDFLNQFALENISFKNDIEYNELNSESIKHIRKSITYEMAIYIELKKLLNDSIKLLKANKSDIQFDLPIIKKLEKNDARVEKLLSETCINIATQSINIEIIKYYKPKLNESKKEAYKRIYDQSETLYKRLLAKIKEAEKFSKELLEEI